MSSSPSAIAYGSPEDREKTFRWYVVRSMPHQEKKLAEIIAEGLQREKNILEVFCPVNTTVTVRKNGKDVKAPLYAGHVFVLATYNALRDYLQLRYPDGSILFSRIPRQDDGLKKSLPLTVPEKAMRAFREFNDSYDEQMVVLDRPYSDYAYNPKSGRMNEVVKIMDGMFAGRTGYFVRFGGDRRLVFSILSEEGLPSLTVSIPNIWSFHVVRLVNGEDRKVGSPAERDRAVDMLLGTIQGCGKAEKSLDVLFDVISFLVSKTSWTALCRHLNGVGETLLSKAFAEYTSDDVAMVFNLIRYESDNPGYVKSVWEHNILRPFLTPTSGIPFTEGQDEATILYPDFQETIHRVTIDEDVFYPTSQEENCQSETYYAHIGMTISSDGKTVFFVNWHRLLSEYFLTAGKANASLLTSFRNYAPTLYHILTDADSPVKASESMVIAGHSLCVLYAISSDNTPESQAEARQTLLATALKASKEIFSTTHLASWRRYLDGVWLHR